MRQKVDTHRVEAFMRSLGQATRSRASVYLVGGCSAVLLGWRESTIDVDLKFVPEVDAILREIPRLKERFQINIELAAPDDFIPPLPGWQDRSRFIVREGAIEFFHYDFYSQALAKIERGHSIDRADVLEMIKRGLVEPNRLLRLFCDIEPHLYRYPALDPESFRKSVEDIVSEASG